jgi:phytoene dehydrogenase-like protein
VSVDAVVIGAGPNGLVAANVLADHGWDVVVLEANAEPGGAVRTAEVTAPGYHNDLFSAFYPLGAKSPVMRGLELEDWGLEWARAPLALAHPTMHGPSAVLATDLDETAASLDRFAPGDGDAWRSLYEVWERAGDELVAALLSPFPPVRAAGRLAVAGAPRIPQLLTLGLASLRRVVRRRFAGEGGRLLMAGNAAHADIPMESMGSALFGWIMCCLGQDVGFPSPVGGASELTAALVRRLEAKGGSLVCGARVVEIEVRDGQAVGVRTEAGDVVAAGRAVVADVSAPVLYTDLVGRQHLSARYLRRVTRFDHGPATVKVDWAVGTTVPWRDDACAQAGTVHLADSFEDLSAAVRQVDSGYIPATPFLLVGQMTTVDATRSPAGTESMWAYTHVPQETIGDAGGDLAGKWDDDEGERFADRIEARIEDYAPGFRDRIVARHVFTPRSLEAANANLVGGDVGGGTQKLRQQLVLRPIPGLGRAETPVRGLYLASASAHPGGGVHGACGANAARAALVRDRLRRTVRRLVG